MIGKIIKKIRTGFYTNLCKKTAKQYGKGLHINHWSKFTSKTYIGDNCHFNGMKVTGNGNVTIGNNFHSGGGILILTSNHNYEGKSIPYDETTIDGDVVIEDNVWLGQNVKLEKLNRELEKSEKKLRKAINDEKALQHQLKQLTRKERTHRLCTRGGMLESFLQEPEHLTDDDVMLLLKLIFHRQDTQELLKKLLEREKPETL